ncbi:membrane-bound metal-dependent hydrolase [Arthrobacter crystallopoietes BAB-32]|uniref:Membrane-bound metal-dependent hydrolase n=1 Tax=Arthrobacter crystallopoietes BAB-32 TaxID=1246476 RepID=N1V0G0_9MICC|nr:metal-dependent hydrolase [Arthrobacter crystallopoietes]EMY36141.1 membrane-bound metal-dependent hydrolase [Arthrobacter crystallopoietes BAB-32]
MMGAHHAATGAAAWVALTTQLHLPLDFITVPMGWGEHSLALGFGLLDVGPLGVLTGALVTAGAALVPDADHHNATIAHSLPPLSNIACAGIGKFAGGHRHGTHSLIGIAAFVAVAWVAGLWTVETKAFGTVTPLAGLLCVFLVAFAAKALKFIPDRMRKVPWAVGLAAAALITVFAPEQQNWFPLAMGTGVIMHILGDMLTTGGCNLVWPFTIKPPKALQGIPVLKRIWQKNGYVSFPVLGNAGSVREWLLLVPVSLYVIVAMASSTIDLGQQTLTALAEGL